MPTRTKISTKTTRNEEFNHYYDENGVINTVTSMTATKDTPNIKLLDVNQAIVKQGLLIKEDTSNNTTLIEVTLQVNHETALRLYDYSIGNIPDPTTNPKGYAEYEYYGNVLKEHGMTYDNIRAWIADYKDNDWMNEEAGIKFNTDSNYYIFGAPEQVILNNRQHYNNCGIESTLNNLAMAGIVKMDENLKDQEKVETSFLQSVWERNLAGDSNEIGVLNNDDGGTYPDDYRDIMEYFGIDSKSYYITTKSNDFVYPKTQINEMAYKISQGHGAVLGVCSSVLWKNVQSETGKKQIDHAIAITGVVYDTDNINPDDNNGEYVAPVGFYIHDTGAWMTRFISYDDFIDAALCDYVYGEKNTETTLTTLKQYDSRLNMDIKKEVKGIFITLTDEPIKIDTFNLNVTGDKYDNMLWGNSSSNLIKGMNGNDVMYGGAGRDEIYGGNGNDIVIGNEAYTLKVKLGDEVLYESHTINDFKEYLDKADVLSESVEAQLDKVEVKDYGDLTIQEFIDLENVIPKGINTLYGDAGNDIIIGGEQADLIYGGNGNDYVWGGFGRNAIYGGNGNDVIVGGYDNDRLFGDAGNDVIFGMDDSDVINGGAGNDHLFGGRGSDTIETGAGNDTVYFEGTEFGQDQIIAKSGNTVFKFVDEGEQPNASSAYNMFFSLEGDQKNEKVNHLAIQYKQGDLNDDESQIMFTDFLTVKSGKTKALTLDADDGIYTVSVSNKAKAKVTNVKTTGATKINGEKVYNADINNVLLTTYDEGTTITTSDKNDIVTMCDSEGIFANESIDNITYTGGIDKYVSEERNTYYTAGDITLDTSLAIYDNVIGLTRIIFDDDIMIKDKNYTSKDDRLYLGEDKANYLFDVSLDENNNAITTENSGLYLFDVDNYKPSTYVSDVSNIVKGETDYGFIYMDSFFKFDDKEDTLIAGNDFYGNGQIEGFYYEDSDEPYSYNNDLTSIASQVASWLENHTDYASAFDAFKNDAEDLADLIACYTTANLV